MCMLNSRESSLVRQLDMCVVNGRENSLVRKLYMICIVEEKRSWRF